jgi:hypothetical protein
LKKALLAGGAAIEVSREIVGGVWATGVWTDTDEIVLRDRRGLFRVSADGGALAELGGENLIGEWQGRPDYVREANAVLAVNSSSSNQGTLVAIDRDTGMRKSVLADVRAARFVPTGHLVVQRGAALLLMGIDPATLEIQGDAVPLTDPRRACVEALLLQEASACQSRAGQIFGVTEIMSAEPVVAGGFTQP